MKPVFEAFIEAMRLPRIINCIATWLAAFVPLSAAAIEFSVKHAQIGGPALHAVAAGPDRVVAVGANGTVFLSDDGEHWEQLSSLGGWTLRGVTFGNGVFVAVGDGGTIVRSTDGRKWATVGQSSTSLRLNAVCYYGDGFLAVGEDGTAIKSGDGTNWVSVGENAVPAFYDLRTAEWAGPGSVPFIGGTSGMAGFMSSDIQYVFNVPQNPGERFSSETIGHVSRHGDSETTYFGASGEAGFVIYPQGLGADGHDEVYSAQTGVFNYLETSETMEGILATQGGAFAFGTNGAIFHERTRALDRKWQALNSPTAVTLRGGVVFGGAAYLVGDDATVLQSESLQSGYLVNISTRAYVGSDVNQMIAGFVVRGDEPRPMLLRAVGPTLARYGVSDLLEDPVLELYNGKGDMVMSNQRWGSGGDALAIAEASATVGAFSLEAGSADAAIFTTLQPGLYTAVVSGRQGSKGNALVEVYDLGGQPKGGLALSNISTRARVGATASDPMIAGLVVAGHGPRKVLVRAVGSTLGSFGLPDALVAPMVEIVASDGSSLDLEGDWSRVGADAAVRRKAAATAGAFALQEGSLEVSWIAELDPGSWTVLVRGLGGDEGVALIEIYDITPDR